MTTKASRSLDDPTPLRPTLDAVEPKPDVSSTREEKHAYASRLSRRLAVFAASALRREFPRILPTEDDVGHESVTGGSEGGKRLDVKAWDDVLGLELLVSIKTYSFQDWDGRRLRAGRYTKNVKRNGFELMHEADVIHRRQPYSVMVGLLFLPDTACVDGDENAIGDRGASSFASIVRRLRVRSGRALDPDEKKFDRFDLAERLYIALYRFDGDGRGALRFFDVSQNPPRVGAPDAAGTLTLGEWVAEVRRLVDLRNSTSIEWAVLTEEMGSDEVED